LVVRTKKILLVVEQDFHVLSIKYSIVFYIKAILLSLAKVKVETKICKKQIDHNVCHLFRRCKSNIFFNYYNQIEKKMFIKYFNL